ncbi:MAG TPA: nickel pincer cofactor biosynthesis protein LarC [Opitutaceae bacterium]|nr:nickel pincer cofactor biosynthesis protein LarC [Opitutaceae bacterium]
MPEHAAKVLYYDCSAGISGDMHLGAMVDLGVPPEHLEAELKKLGLPGWRLRFTRDSRKGIGGTRADVLLDGEPDPLAGSTVAQASLPAALGSAAPVAGLPGTTTFTPVAKLHAPLVPGHEPHEHRNHRDIVAMIEHSSLADGTKRRALAIFARLAEAEAKIHGMPVAEVGFHEVGAVDSIVDIVAAAIALEWLKPDRILVSTIELGGGFVKCAHGRLSVPAPATADLLRGAPTRLGTVPFEATTPTGAAILAASATEFTDRTDFTIERIGYGIGHKDGPIPNILRLFLGTDIRREDTGASAVSAPPETAAAVAPCENATVLECNLDDMTGETAGYVLEKLLAAGASDAWLTPIVMKKSRPALTLSVLCPPEKESALTELILRETTTFGLRRREVGKLALERTLVEVATSLGNVRVKTAWLDGRPLKSKPEHDDLRRLAETHHLPLREVERHILAELAQRETKP